MSQDSLPSSDDPHKPGIFIDEDSRVAILMRLLCPADAAPLSLDTVRQLLPPCDAPHPNAGALQDIINSLGRPSATPSSKPSSKRRPRRARAANRPVTPYQAKRMAMEDMALQRLRRDGFTPYFGNERHFLMSPPDFSLVLACESRYVALVIHEVLSQTVGYVGDSEGGRREWAVLSFRHFERKGLLSHQDAKRALDYAVDKGYLLRRRKGKQQWEYAVHYQQVDNVPR